MASHRCPWSVHLDPSFCGSAQDLINSTDARLANADDAERFHYSKELNQDLLCQVFSLRDVTPSPQKGITSDYAWRFLKLPGRLAQLCVRPYRLSGFCLGFGCVAPCVSSIWASTKELVLTACFFRLSRFRRVFKGDRIPVLTNSVAGTVRSFHQYLLDAGVMPAERVLAFPR